MGEELKVGRGNVFTYSHEWDEPMKPKGQKWCMVIYVQN